MMFYRGLLITSMVVASHVPIGESSAQNIDDRFVYIERTAPRTLNPIFMKTMSELRVSELLYSSLFKEGPSYALVGDLVAKYSVGSNGESLAIQRLKPKMWADGSRVTLKDVEFSLRTILEEKRSIHYAGLQSLIKSMELRGSQLVIRFNQPIGNPEYRLRSVRIVPARYYQGPAKVDKRRVDPIGSGPYKFVNWSGTKMRFERGPRSKAKIPKVEMKVVPDDLAQLVLMNSGGASALVRVYPRQIPEYQALEEQGSIRLHPYDSVSWWYIAFNHKRPHFAGNDAQPVREAYVFCSNISNTSVPLL